MTQMERLLQFCMALNLRRAHYELLVLRPDAAMVALDVPGQRWEIEFFADGRIEVERFVSQGVEANLEVLKDALKYFDE